MKILHLSYSSCNGAGNAARRLHESLKRADCCHSKFVYFQPYRNSHAQIGWLEKKINGLANILIQNIAKSESLNIVPTSLLRYINRSDADIVHLHWIQGEMISINQIAKITKPIVWTFHDMWPVCGSEHYTHERDYIDGYENDKADLTGRGSVHWIRRWTWNRKRKAFSAMHFKVLTPGTWMTSCAKESHLFKHMDCETLFNPLDTSIFYPHDNVVACKQKYKIPLDKKIILFGACKPTETRKGWDLLLKALALLNGREDICLVIFGDDREEQVASMQTLWLGRIQEEQEMAEIYSCADVMCVPSRMETFGQTASEPQACGTPVVAFNATGLKDVVEHKVTGYLATPFDTDDFARGIEWVLDADADLLTARARERAIKLFDQAVIADQAMSIYERILNEGASSIAENVSLGQA